MTHPHGAPARLSSRLALLAGASWMLSGCAVVTIDHYITNARVETPAPPIIPALNTADKEGYASLGFRVGAHNETDANLQARFNGDTTYTYDPYYDQTDIWHTSPGNYILSRPRYTVGADFRAVANRHFDVFVSANLDPKRSGSSHAVLIGLGLTFTTPVAHFRIAPAGGLHRYFVNVRDSLLEHWDWQYSDDFDTMYVKRVREKKLDNFGAVSFSVWLPENLVGPVKPYVQYQYQTTYIQSELLVKDALTVDVSTWVAGLNVAVSKNVALNLSVAREDISNDLSRDAFYKAESALEFKFPNE